MTIIPITDVSITQIAQALLEGKTIVYPTETCYGLGASATNDSAVARLFDIKQRQQHKSMLCLMQDVSMAMEYVCWSPTLEKIATRYWPGALTVVAEQKPDVTLAQGVVASDHTISFRVSSHPFCHELMRVMNTPIVSTSANISSMESPYDIDHVIDMFSQNEAKPDIIIDAGPLPHRPPSTIVKVDGTKKIVIRQGDIIVS